VEFYLFKSSQQDITVMYVEDLDHEQRCYGQLRNPENVILVGAGRRTGTAVAQWLRCCATNRKVAGSIPAGVIGIFH